MKRKAFIYADEKEVFVQGTQLHYGYFLENIAFSCTRAMLHTLSSKEVKSIITKSIENGIKKGEEAYKKGDWS